ncbi:hypothetical protein FPHYL_2946 [Fusarium phyllophilum]|uniref:Uncharacterized protein n=1 Tax=Fusarium phyllophilum TaxID=47803 RepID=A0A8H5NJU5_9HYPO|nr:hypothetical protein FPHYL_2946 [Fusarium phyllophilum]
MSFRNVNAKAHSITESVLDCKDVMAHSSTALINIISTGLSRRVTMGEIHLALTSSKCGFCEEYHEPPNHLSHHQQRHTMVSGDSLVVTDPTTNPPVSGLTMGEQTGSRIFHYLWSNGDQLILNVLERKPLPSALPHLEEFILVMHEACHTWGLHKIHQVASTKRPGVDIGESTGQRCLLSDELCDSDCSLLLGAQHPVYTSTQEAKDVHWRTGYLVP